MQMSELIRGVDKDTDEPAETSVEKTTPSVQETTPSIQQVTPSKKPVILQQPTKNVVFPKAAPTTEVKKPPETLPETPPDFKIYKVSERPSIPVVRPTFIPTKRPSKQIAPQIITQTVVPSINPTVGLFYTVAVLPTILPQIPQVIPGPVSQVTPEFVPQITPDLVIALSPPSNPNIPPSIPNFGDTGQEPSIDPNKIYFLAQQPSVLPPTPYVLPPTVVPFEYKPESLGETQAIKPKQVPLRLTWSITSVEDSNPVAVALADDQKAFKESIVQAEKETWTIEKTKDKTPEKEEILQTNNVGIGNEKLFSDDFIISDNKIDDTKIDTTNGEIPFKNDVNFGMFIQLASYKKEGNAKEASRNQNVKSVLQKDKLFLYKNDLSSYYKLLVGPFRRDEIGLELVRVQGSGFGDAFVYSP